VGRGGGHGRLVVLLLAAHGEQDDGRRCHDERDDDGCLRFHELGSSTSVLSVSSNVRISPDSLSSSAFMSPETSSMACASRVRMCTTLLGRPPTTATTRMR